MSCERLETHLGRGSSLMAGTGAVDMAWQPCASQPPRDEQPARQEDGRRSLVQVELTERGRRDRPFRVQALQTVCRRADELF